MSAQTESGRRKHEPTHDPGEEHGGQVSFQRVRGSRLVERSEQIAPGHGWTWFLICGHTVVRRSAHGCQKSAICPACRADPKPPPTTSRKRASAAYVERRRARHDALGLCRACKTPAVEGRKYCETHLEYFRERSRRAYYANRIMTPAKSNEEGK